MNKSQEIAKIDSLISHLGKESYLGQSIADQREQIIADIRSDLMPLQFGALRALHTDALKEIDALHTRKTALEQDVANLELTQRRLTTLVAESKSKAAEIAARLTYAIS